MKALRIFAIILFVTCLGLFIWRVTRPLTPPDLNPNLTNLELYQLLTAELTGLTTELRWLFGLLIGILISFGIFLISFINSGMNRLQDGMDRIHNTLQDGINRVLDALH